jgi:diamine N-acetyltransferase
LKYLENSIIKLRAPELTDLELLYKWENDTEVWHVGVTNAPFSKYVLEKYLETAHLELFDNNQLRLMIDLKADNNRTIGTIDLFDFDTYNNRVGVGILIAENTDKGNGYASETLVLIIDYCFSFLGLNQLYCNIAEDNVISIQLFKKHGFEVVGLKKQWTRRGVGYSNEYLLQLINANRI